MSVKNFKFVSPGVFIHEIDNSFIPKSAQEIGPCILGRAQRGLAMQPVTVESFSQFVEMFGDTVPGMGGGSPSSGDVYRYGNYQSPMYGTYAAKAFLKSNVAPVTYVRLLGQQATDATTAGEAGWKTAVAMSASGGGGGAYGLWLFSSGSSATTMTGTLGAIIYTNAKDSTPLLSGALWCRNDANASTASIGAVVNTDSNGYFTLQIGTTGKKVKFNFDDTGENFIRKKLNTNPQMMVAGDFYATSSEVSYWLGETYEQAVRDAGLNSGASVCGIIANIALSGSSMAPSATKTPANMKTAAAEAASGWFIGQDLGPAASYNPAKMQKLFRLKGRGHGEWLHKNVKVSIDNLRQSNSSVTDYGTFSVILRAIHDTDNNVQVIERYDNCTMDPTSPDFVARRIGDKYQAWDSTKRLLREYGEYPNNSKYVYVEMNSDAEAGATDALLLPFGYQGPPKYTDVGMRGDAIGSASMAGGEGRYVIFNSVFLDYAKTGSGTSTPANCFVSGSTSGAAATTSLDLSLKFPYVRLRNSASDGGLTDPTDAFFGYQTTRESGSTKPDMSVGDFGRALYGGVAGSDLSAGSYTGIDNYSYIFSMDDVAKSGSNYYYSSGSRVRGDSVGATSYKDLLDANYNAFTAPFFGGADGFNILNPDPLYNTGMGAASNERNSSIYYTWRRAIDTVADPEFIDMNVLVAPGLTNDSLTTHMINTCEDRADCLALIDLPDVYVPPHEKYYANKNNRLVKNPLQAATALKDRRIDSSYGCTFYPWVQTRDENTGILLWIPPSVAMLGVLASSQAKSHVWFAPAGFNRGGLTEGAAGIPVTSVIRRLTSKNRDTLYDNRINPIASFPSTGIVVFGQKTLQQRQSALDRINVRRLVIFLKKQISILAAQILFEQNVEATWTRFKSLIEPFLANVKTQFGITDYRLILDESTTTPDLIDQNILYAKIMVKPARAIEFIAIDFVITSTGASFDD